MSASPARMRDVMLGRCAGGVRMFNNRADWLVEFLGQVPGGLHVNDIVVRKFLALNLAAVGHTCARAVGVHGGFLVGIFSVAQVHDLLERQP